MLWTTFRPVLSQVDDTRPCVGINADVGHCKFEDFAGAEKTMESNQNQDPNIIPHLLEAAPGKG